MDPVLEFGIEAACLTGLVLLGAVVSRPKFGGKRWDRAMWIRATGVLVVGLGYFFVNPRGWPDPFPVVIGCTVFVVVTVGLFLAMTLGWRLGHRERRAAMRRRPSRAAVTPTGRSSENGPKAATDRTGSKLTWPTATRRFRSRPHSMFGTSLRLANAWPSHPGRVTSPRWASLAAGR